MSEEKQLRFKKYPAEVQSKCVFLSVRMTRWAQHQDEDRGFRGAMARVADDSDDTLDVHTGKQHPPPFKGMRTKTTIVDVFSG